MLKSISRLGYELTEKVAIVEKLRTFNKVYQQVSHRHKKIKVNPGTCIRRDENRFARGEGEFD